jgi:hypothetical protein
MVPLFVFALFVFRGCDGINRNSASRRRAAELGWANQFGDCRQRLADIPRRGFFETPTFLGDTRC